MGLLDSNNPAPFDLSGLAGQLQQLLGQLSPSDEDKRSAQLRALATFGAGLLGTPRGQDMAGFSRAGLLGLDTYRQNLKDMQNQKLESLKMVQMLPALQQVQDAASERQVLRSAYADRATPQAAPTAQPAPPIPSFGMNDRGTGVAPQTPVGTSAPTATPAPLQQTGVAPQTPVASVTPSFSDRVQRAQQYRSIGDRMSAAGLGDRAQVYYDMAEKMLPKLKEQKTLTQGDRRVTVNIYDDGTTQVLPDLSPDKEKAVQVSNGQQTYFGDPFTGQPVTGGAAFKLQPTPGEQLSAQTTMRGQNMSNQLGYANLSESKRYHNLEMGVDPNGNPTNVDAVAKAIANYDQPPLGSFTAGKPFGAAIMSKVMEFNPSYDAKNYATSQQTMNAFAKGSQGNTVRSIGVAMQHLDTLGQVAAALDNGNVPLFNRAANFYATQTGQAAPTNFNAVKDIVANEVTKAIVGSGGGVSDRDKAQQTVNAANSPAQLAAVMNSYKNLFAGQLSGLEQQYKAGTQRDDFATRFLPPQVQELRKRGGAGAPQPHPGGWSVVQIQ